MSTYATTAVWKHSQSTGSDRLLLLAIADSAHRDGGGVWRGKASLARMTRLSRTTITDCIANLEALGELEVTRRPGSTSTYRVTLPGIDDDEADEGRPESGLPTRPKSGRHPAGIRPTPGQTGGRDTSKETSNETGRLGVIRDARGTFLPGTGWLGR